MTGIIRKISDRGSSDPFIARMYMQVANIRDSVIPFSNRSERERFDQAYQPILTNLHQCLATCDDIQTMWNGFVDDVLNGRLVRFDGRVLHIDKVIDLDLERKTKEFFNRGKNAIDLLDKLKPWMGFALSRFNKSEDDFAKARVALLSSVRGEEYSWYERRHGVP